MLGVATDRLAGVHEEWIEAALAKGQLARDAKWSEAIAAGRRCFVEEVQRTLGVRAHYRSIAEDDGASVLRETDAPCGIISASECTA